MVTTTKKLEYGVNPKKTQVILGRFLLVFALLLLCLYMFSLLSLSLLARVVVWKPRNETIYFSITPGYLRFVQKSDDFILNAHSVSILSLAGIFLIYPAYLTARRIIIAQKFSAD